MSTREERIAESNARRDRRIARRQEQERLIAEGVMCGFGEVYGVCVRPTNDSHEWCDRHDGVQCTNCHRQATKECDHIGMMMCGFPVCDDCRHPHGRKRKLSGPK